MKIMFSELVVIMCVLHLTERAVGEELDVVSQTKLLHLCCRALINQRVLDLHAKKTCKF